MKLAIVLVLSTFSLSSFAQSTCEMRVEKLREKLSQVSEELRMCQLGNTNSSEIQYLRTENYRLQEANRVLQLRIDELEGRGFEQYFCSASCVNYNGSIDNRYISSATAPTQVEADLVAKQQTQKKYSCNYGVKTYKCEVYRGDLQRNFCTAACVNYNGTPDERFAAGARGRNVTEAEVLAIKEVQSKFQCNYGIKVMQCN